MPPTGAGYGHRMTVRIGIVGAGSVAARHARVLSGLGDAAVVSVADPAPGAAARLAADCDATAHLDPVAMLDAERLDAVYVCVPPFAHGGPERAALARGLPLFVEKPLAADLATAEALGAEIAAAGVLTGTGYHWRCLDTVQRARELLADRPARLAAGYWLDVAPPISWWNRADRSGGQVIERVTHLIDLARVLVGEVESVSAEAIRTAAAWEGSPAADVDDVTVATVRFAGGAVGTLTGSCLLPRKSRVALHTVSPGLSLDLTETELTVEDGAGVRVLPAAVDPRVQVDREFVDAVLGRRDGTRAPYAEALASHRVACAVTRSARTGSPAAPGPPGPVGTPGLAGSRPAGTAA